MWTRHTAELVDELWVDSAAFVALVQSLTPAEKAWIDQQLKERGHHD